MIGCADSVGNSPVIPGPDSQLTGDTPTDLTSPADRTPESAPDPKNYLWGYYDCYLDVENNAVEAVPNRSLMFNANVVTYLNANPAFFTFSINSIKASSQFTDVDINVSIKHPFTGKTKLNGYDVRCVFIGYGSGELVSNGLKYPVFSQDMHMRDDPNYGDGGSPDGYTRWFNPTEFATPGLFGYTHGSKAFMTDFTIAATLCPYKYYTDFLGANDDVKDWILNNPETNGVFTAGFTNTRNYYIRFPKTAGLHWAYAVVASWAGGQPEDHPANTPEAVAGKITDNSILFYVDETSNGGILDFDVRLYGWGEQPSTILVESTVMSGVYTATPEQMVPTASGPTWVDYHITCPADNVIGLTGNEMWVMPRYDNFDYSNPFGVPNTADGLLTAYFRSPLMVDNEAPPCEEPPQLIINTLYPAYVGEVYHLQLLADGGDGALTWSLDPGSELPDGIEFSSEGLLSGIPVDGTQGIWPDIFVRVQDSCLAGPQTDTNTYSMTVIGPKFIVTAPNGGEDWAVGSSHEITWIPSDTYDAVDILYSKDNFNVDFQYIVQSTENDGSFLWDYVPSDASDYVLMRVQASGMPQYYDDSDDYFKISGAWLQVLDPNGGENLPTFGNYEILWDSQNVIGNVNIWYSKDHFDLDWHQIVLFDPNDGSFLWENIPDDESSTVRILIESIVNPDISDESDADFSISAVPLTVQYPNGGEEFWFGTSEDINWTTGGVTGNVDIRYSSDNFSSDVNIIADNVPNSGTFTWNDIPMDFSDTLKVRIRSHDEPGFYDDSDSNFSIVDHGWAKTSGSPVQDQGGGVVVDSTGNAYVAGTFNERCFFAKYDAYGQQIWQKEWCSDGSNITWGIGLDGLGNVYLAGNFTDAGVVDFDPGPGTDNHTKIGVQDALLVKYDSTGTYQWGVTWGGAGGITEAYGLAVDSSGKCFITGKFSQETDFDPDPVENFDMSPSGTYDAYLAIFDSAGNFVTAGQWGGASDDVGYDVALNGSQTLVCVTGGFKGAGVDFDPGAGTENHSSNGGQDIFLSCFNPDGSHNWAYTWGGTTTADCGAGVASDSSDNIYVCGSVFGTDVDMDPTGTTDIQSTTGPESSSFVSKFNSSAVYSWARIWGGGPGAVDGDQADGVAVDGFGNIFVAGRFEDMVDFDPGPGEDIRTSASWAWDGYLTKFDSSGNYLLANTVSGTDVEVVQAVAVDSSGTAWTVGAWGSINVDFAPNDPSCATYSDIHNISASLDFFLVKYMSDGCW